VWRFETGGECASPGQRGAAATIGIRQAQKERYKSAEARGGVQAPGTKQTDIGGREREMGGKPTATPLLSPFQVAIVRYREDIAIKTPQEAQRQCIWIDSPP